MINVLCFFCRKSFINQYVFQTLCFNKNVVSFVSYSIVVYSFQISSNVLEGVDVIIVFSLVVELTR